MAIDKNLVAEHAVEIDISAVDYEAKTAAVYVGVAGTVKVTTFGGDTASFIGVAAGSILPVLVSKVWKVGTDADSMVALI